MYGYIIKLTYERISVRFILESVKKPQQHQQQQQQKQQQ